MMYSDRVTVEVTSMLSGKHTDYESLAELKTSTIGVLREWANDDDLQYLQVCSTNIGFARTYSKQWDRAAKAAQAVERDEGMKISIHKLPSGYYHIRGPGPCNWAQVPFWPCDEACIRRHAFQEASEEFVLSAVRRAAAERDPKITGVTTEPGFIRAGERQLLRQAAEREGE